MRALLLHVLAEVAEVNAGAVYPRIAKDRLAEADHVGGVPERIEPQNTVRREGTDGVAGCYGELDPRPQQQESKKVRRAALITAPDIVSEHVARNAALQEESISERYVRDRHERERQRLDAEWKATNEA